MNLNLNLLISILKNKKWLAIFIGSVLFILLTIILIIIQINTSSPQSQLTPTTTVSPTEIQIQPTIPPTETPEPNVPTPTNNPDDYFKNNASYLKSLKEIQPTEQVQLNQDSLVSAFIQSLPYQGVYIQVVYNIDNNSVYLVLNKNFQTQANKEFDDLLKERGIQSRSWFDSLVVTTK